jgi:TetR/AcrR family tetracycline transcriptional repressor
MTETPAARRRGRPRLIDRDRIIEMARSLDPSTLTMQGLADEMGVDRKTLHYHVSNRDSLLKLVAADAFREAITASDFAPGADWRESLRAFALITRGAVAQAGAWASFVNFDSEDDLEALLPAEAAISALTDAGLDEASAGRVVSTLAVLAFSSARDESVSEDTEGRHPQEPNLRHALESTDDERYARIRRLLSGQAGSLGSRQQFDFEIDLILRGVEGLLHSGDHERTGKKSKN